MSQSLAVKYRPKTLTDLTEQSITVQILQKVVESGKPKNAYLFAGESGCGKTTAARAFANALNSGVGDPIEIDAASNNGVDQVRNIIESATQRSLTGTYKVFIIDEAHAITSQGWQAFLKGIEEPPAFTIYIFCTTEPQKIPATILNRVQRFNFTKISMAGLKARLEYICQAEGFSNYTQTCDLISKICNGRMRDAITYLDQCADYSHDLSIENTRQILGDVPYEQMLQLTNYLIDGDCGKVIQAIEFFAATGKDLRTFIDNYLNFVLDLSKYIIFKDISITEIPQYLETVQDQSINIQYTTGIENGLNWFMKLVDRVLEIKNAIKQDSSAKTTIEAYLLKTCRGL